MLTTGSAFQHVRSLDLGVTGKYSNPEDCLEQQLTILQIFAQRQTLTRVWLSRVTFPALESCGGIKVQDIITALGSTVSDMGLYGCLFPSYADLISFILAFPHCDSLFVRNCVTNGTNSGEGIFSGLPKHKLSLNVLELSSSSSDGLIIDVASLIEAAGLDVSRLSSLTCDVESVTRARSLAKATSTSPIRHFQLTSTKPDVFRGARKNWVFQWYAEISCFAFKSSSSQWERSGT